LITALSIQACSHLPLSWKARQQLETAKGLMYQGHFDAALRETEDLLGSFPRTMGDEALYLMGIIYAHPDNPNSSWDRSLESFQILAKRYPKSNLIQSSEIWVSMIQKIRDSEKMTAQLKDTIDKKNRELDNLKTQLDKLKKIDLGIEEEKRRNLPH